MLSAHPLLFSRAGGLLPHYGRRRCQITPPYPLEPLSCARSTASSRLPLPNGTQLLNLINPGLFLKVTSSINVEKPLKRPSTAKSSRKPASPASSSSSTLAAFNAPPPETMPKSPKLFTTTLPTVQTLANL